jgi:predicted adenylyl cyclase CyaB
MARNVEIKTRIENIALILPRVADIADQGPIEIIQDDIFFACENGRIKLRVFSPDRGELIFYRRADQKGPKESFYLISHTTSPERLRDSLSMAYGEVGRVRKNRTLFIAGRTRIHLDRVEGLGDFVELEVVLDESEDAAIGEAIAHDLMLKLGIMPEQLVAGAYVDLLAARNPKSKPK